MSCTVWSDIVHPARHAKDDDLGQEAFKGRLAELLKGAEAHCAPWSNQLDVSVEDGGTTSGFLRLPLLSWEQLELAIPSAVARELPCTLNEVQIFSDSVPLLADGDKKIGIFYVAVPKRAIEARVALLNSLGCEVRRCEPAVRALLQGIKRNQSLSPKESLAIVDCGFHKTTVLLVHGGHPYFSREFRVAGSDFTYAYQMGKQISWVEAEAQKWGYDVEERDYHVEPFVVRWLTEVKRSIDFALRSLPGLKPGRAILTGGSSSWKGLARRLSEALSLPVGPSGEATGQGEAGKGTYDIAQGLVSS